MSKHLKKIIILVAVPSILIFLTSGSPARAEVTGCSEGQIPVYLSDGTLGACLDEQPLPQESCPEGEEPGYLVDGTLVACFANYQEISETICDNSTADADQDGGR